MTFQRAWDTGTACVFCFLQKNIQKIQRSCTHILAKFQVTCDCAVLRCRQTPPSAATPLCGRCGHQWHPGLRRHQPWRLLRRGSVAAILDIQHNQSHWHFHEKSLRLKFGQTQSCSGQKESQRGRHVNIIKLSKSSPKGQVLINCYPIIFPFAYSSGEIYHLYIVI